MEGAHRGILKRIVGPAGRALIYSHYPPNSLTHRPFYPQATRPGAQLNSRTGYARTARDHPGSGRAPSGDGKTVKGIFSIWDKHASCLNRVTHIKTMAEVSDLTARPTPQYFERAC